MANKEQILDKIARNMSQRSLSAERVGETVEVTKDGGAGDVIVVSYKEKDIASPMGGVSDQSSPFLGIGVAAPGSIKIKGAAGENTIAAIFDDSDSLELLSECSGFANDVEVEAGDSSTELARIRGQADTIGLGS
jgi:hypothetical protein